MSTHMSCSCPWNLTTDMILRRGGVKHLWTQYRMKNIYTYRQLHGSSSIVCLTMKLGTEHRNGRGTDTSSFVSTYEWNTAAVSALVDLLGMNTLQAGGIEWGIVGNWRWHNETLPWRKGLVHFIARINVQNLNLDLWIGWQYCTTCFHWVSKWVGHW